MAKSTLTEDKLPVFISVMHHRLIGITKNGWLSRPNTEGLIKSPHIFWYHLIDISTGEVVFSHTPNLQQKGLDKAPQFK